MSFHIEPSSPSSFVPDPRLPRLVRMVMRLSGGRIRSEHQANAVLTLIAGVIFALSLLIFVIGLR